MQILSHPQTRILLSPSRPKMNGAELTGYLPRRTRMARITEVCIRVIREIRGFHSRAVRLAEGCHETLTIPA